MNKKVVVFDLDETIGHFQIIRVVWDSLKRFINFNSIPYVLDGKDFNVLMEMFSEVLRPEIFNIFSKINNLKRTNECNGIMIYTNNRYNKEWVYMILNYIESIVNEKVFDNVILAFKYNGKIQQACRTGNEKKLDDFLRCCKLPKSVQICYFDDVEHSQMVSDEVYYLKVKPYFFTYSHKYVLNTIYNSILLTNILLAEKDTRSLSENKRRFLQYLQNCLEFNGVEDGAKNKLEQNIDVIVSKRIMSHLNIFFNQNIF
tara:strand:+ start:13192 stop:13965 length:774 start_codon:yes stop_codon:yes gene_type:complete